ncbi:ATP-dependent DNA helicase PIF1 [Hirsutella rhossiliensis]|uniref:ATP-dependent DNA helicase PIF1 n=1 Tax=Hirsutella rhossiliensis TaxID=111463 RepID=A0A9P8MKA1_9HYPO|nr:ATP-dependent DNA helicase PIF1 [Hirsutella rhossiliensis]KAH0956912.1 ATP-dependent DNA helicase PIF1 [Hirsutella rhossiliensis]
MVRVAKDSFHRLEQAYANLNEDRLKRAEAEMRETRTTSDPDISVLLRELSIFGHAQPLSNESRLLMRRKIQAVNIWAGMPAVWITISPNDINNPIKMKLAIHRLHDYDSAKELLADLREKYDRIALSTMDPVSSAIFFHREISLFFDKYVNTGRESIFGKISHYYATVETNERGSLHLHGLLWLEGNMRLPNLMDDMANPGRSIPCPGDPRKPIDPVEEVMTSTSALTAAFEDESNFIAGRSTETDSLPLQGTVEDRRGDRVHRGWQQAVLNESRQFLMRTANRIFSERQLSAVEVCYHLLGYDTDFTNVPHWSFLNLTALYWAIFRLWSHLRHQAGELTDAEQPAETIRLRQGGRTLLYLDAYAYRGHVLRDLCLYDYMSMIHLDSDCDDWIQKLRRPDQYAIPIFQGYISDDHEDDHPVYIKRNSVLHLALFVPWEKFISESQGDITDIWTTHRSGLCPRLRFHVSNIGLLRKSAEDARKDAKLWASRSEGDDTIDVEYPLDDGRDEEEPPALAHRQAYKALLQILRNAVQDTDATKTHPSLEV